MKLLLILLLLSGCMGPPRVVSDTPAQVIVTESDIAAGMALANERCQRHGKSARFAGRAPWGKHVYNCE